MKTFSANSLGKACLTLSRVCVLLLLVLGGAASHAGATALEYWDFNNDSVTFSSPNLGSIYNSASSGAGNGNGEKYDNGTKKITSNSASGAAFSNGVIDMSGVTVTGSYANGNGASTGSAQAWGVFSDPGSSGHLLAGDPNAGTGSLIIFGNNTAVDTVVFTLSSAGYSNLTLSLDARPGSNTTFNPSVTWQYSLTGLLGSWTTFSMTGTSSAGLWNPLTGSLASSLNNLSTFYVQEILTFPNATSGSYAIDNLLLSGTALAVPEPSTWALLLAGGGLVVWSVRRRLVEARARA